MPEQLLFMQLKNAKNLYEMDKLFITNNLMNVLENSGCLPTVSSNHYTKNRKGKKEKEGKLYLFN